MIFIGCNKDKFTTKPQVKFKEVNSDVFGNGSRIEFKLGFTDKEGDFPGKAYIQRVTPGCPADTNVKYVFDLPEFPTSSNFEGDIIMTFGYNSNIGKPIMPATPGECGDTATSYFRFAIEDKAGNKSDTINSDNVIFINN